VDRLAREAWPETVRRAGKHALVFDARRLGRLPRALAGELVRRAVLSLGPEAHDFGLEDFDRVLRVTEGKPRRASIGSGLEAERIGEDLILRREGAPDPLPQFPQLTSSRPRRLRPGAAIRLAQGWRLALREVRLTEAVRRALLGNANPNLAAFDSRGLPEPLRLRPPIAGDRLRPLGLRGTKKVADLLIDCRIPRPARALWPVLLAGETPIWVVGLRQGGEGRLTPASKRALIVEATPPAP
jgi:tRNA(Ile)-lysidine synthetase-like protein